MTTLPPPGLEPPQPPLELCQCGEVIDREAETDEHICFNCQAERAGCSNGVLYPEAA